MSQDRPGSLCAYSHSPLRSEVNSAASWLNMSGVTVKRYEGVQILDHVLEIASSLSASDGCTDSLSIVGYGIVLQFQMTSLSVKENLKLGIKIDRTTSAGTTQTTCPAMKHDAYSFRFVRIGNQYRREDRRQSSFCPRFASAPGAAGARDRPAGSTHKLE